MMAGIFLTYFIAFIFCVAGKRKLSLTFIFLGSIFILLMLKHHATDPLNLVF